MPIPFDLTEPEPAFVPYDLEIDGALFTVLENQQPDAYRVRDPQGRVLGLMVESNAEPLTAETLAELLTA